MNPDEFDHEHGDPGPGDDAYPPVSYPVDDEPAVAIAPRLTKREYFAGQALAGMMANDNTTRVASRRVIAAGCVALADLLLTALSEGEAP